MRREFLPPPRQREPEPSGFMGPGPEDRVTILGMTGSGKSTFAMWLFSEYADFDSKPWLIIDYKRETLIERALDEGIFKPLAVDARVPDRPGVHVVNPEIDHGPAPVNDLLRRVYKAGRTGILIDETTMIPNTRGEGNTGGPFQSLISQGRSKEIPVWSLSQRPAFINRMAFTENNFFCAFRLRSEADNDKVLEEIPADSQNYGNVWENWRPPMRWSRWYDANRDRSFRLRPCPPPTDIVEILFDRVDKMKKREQV